MFTLECNPARLPRHIEQRRDNRILANVLGNVSLGVVGTHVLLANVFLEHIAQNVRVNLTPRGSGTVIEMPVVLLEEVEDVVECLVRNIDVLPVKFFNLVLQKES